MSRPIGATAAKAVRESTGGKSCPSTNRPPVSSALLDLIDCSCPDNDGFRAPDATHNLDEEQEIVIDPSAPFLHFDEKKQEQERKRAKKKRDAKAMAKAMAKPRADEPSERPMRGLPKHALEEVYELVRLHGPLTAREAVIRMERCGYPRSATLRALGALQEASRVTPRDVQVTKGQPPVCVYEVAP